MPDEIVEAAEETAEAVEPIAEPEEEIPERITVRHVEYHLVADSLASGACVACGSPKMVESWENMATHLIVRLCEGCQERLFIPLPVAGKE